MSFVAPQLLLGYPTVPLLHGLPRSLTRVLGPLFRLKILRRLGHVLTTPVVAWIVKNFIFLDSSTLFWWPLIRPWPTNARDPDRYMLPYLVAADIVNTSLSAFLDFCGRPV
jgi:cytochrome c oxidase assembly factor CtaG